MDTHLQHCVCFRAHYIMLIEKQDGFDSLLHYYCIYSIIKDTFALDYGENEALCL